MPNTGHIETTGKAGGEIFDAYVQRWRYERSWSFKTDGIVFDGLTKVQAKEARTAMFEARWNAFFFIAYNEYDRFFRECAEAIDAAPVLKKDGSVKGPAQKASKQDRIRAAIVERDGRDCWICGDPIKGRISIEHKNPKALGGSDDLENLAGTHTECNRSIGSLPLEAKLAAIEVIKKKKGNL